MPSDCFLGRDWKSRLADLITHADHEILIVSPYISLNGVRFVAANLPPIFKESGSLIALTDLSPIPICQGATDPVALSRLADAFPTSMIHHLPKLHAKVYVADAQRAIVTSGNLTAGGLFRNYEFGIEVLDPDAAGLIHREMLAFANLGAALTRQQLDAYCEHALQVRSIFQERMRQFAGEASETYDVALRTAEDELLRLRLGGGKIHSVFAKTILYLLSSQKSLTTQQLHDHIASIHPDLCDNSIDRVIDGQRFGKKWKHAVRTSQQMLKRKGQITLDNGSWRVVPA